MDMVIMMWIWLALIAVSALVEAFTMQMVSIWFIPGGLVALILYFCGVDWTWQIIACIIISFVLLFSLRKICIKALFKNKPTEATNSASLVGQTTNLLESITADSKGSLKINDVVWTAVTADNSTINCGERVQITAIQGNKLIVIQAPQKEETAEEEPEQND